MGNRKLPDHPARVSQCAWDSILSQNPPRLQTAVQSDHLGNRTIHRFRPRLATRIFRYDPITVIDHCLQHRAYPDHHARL